MSGSEATRPVLAVLRRSDAFEEVWARLAEEAGAELRLSAEGAELSPLAAAAAVLVVAAGEEGRAAEWVRELRSLGAPDPAVVGADDGHRAAVSALGGGASEYFALPGDIGLLREWLAERCAVRDAGAATAQRERYDFSALVGESPELKAALERAARLIPHGSATILITGETGTGKELLAQAIHSNGPRARRPLVEVNCSALPANLLEAELFGYEKGAFTGAVASKPGLFEAADGGTLFLDEVGELPLELQAKLLRALESKAVRRVGSVRTLTLDVRVIAATHRDLAGAVRERLFREDLYYRLNVLPISLPPLRERGDDVLLLARHFLESFAREYGLGTPGLPPEVARALLQHAWPGNVRELRNALERALLLGGGELRADDLFVEAAAAVPGTAGPLPFPASMDTIEAAAARAMVDRFDGNKSAAADALGISRSRLYRLLDEAES